MRTSQAIEMLQRDLEEHGDQDIRSVWGLVSRDGADDTPREADTEITPGQLLARILNGDKGGRLRLCEVLLRNSRRADECIRRNHEQEIVALKTKYLKFQNKVQEWIASSNVQTTDDICTIKDHQEKIDFIEQVHGVVHDAVVKHGVDSGLY